MAVLLAFGVSAALRLPEGFWAVMSALIVVRPSAGSSLNAGWDRMRGALAGTVLGLAGVGLRHATSGSELASGLVPLVLVTLLAFGAGLTPALRSAPISALIIVTSGGIPGHTAGQVALLRALEIAIGVGAALLVALLDARSRATDRFRFAVAEQLRAMAATLPIDPTQRPDPAAPAAAAESRRAAIRELVILAGSADHETRWLRLRRSATGGPRQPDRHRSSALLVARTGSDIALFERVRQLAGSRGQRSAPASARQFTHDEEAAAIESAAAARLIALADSLEAGRSIADSHPAQQPDALGPASFVLALIEDDLRSLGRLEALQATRVP